MKRTLLATALLALAAGAHAEQAGDWVFAGSRPRGRPQVQQRHTGRRHAEGRRRRRCEADLPARIFLLAQLGLEVVRLPCPSSMRSVNGAKAADAAAPAADRVGAVALQSGRQAESLCRARAQPHHLLLGQGEGSLGRYHLDLGSSWGPALHAGLDFPINDAWLVSVDAR